MKKKLKPGIFDYAKIIDSLIKQVLLKKKGNNKLTSIRSRISSIELIIKKKMIIICYIFRLGHIINKAPIVENKTNHVSKKHNSF